MSTRAVLLGITGWDVTALQQFLHQADGKNYTVQGDDTFRAETILSRWLSGNTKATRKDDTRYWKHIHATFAVPVHHYELVHILESGSVANVKMAESYPGSYVAILTSDIDTWLTISHPGLDNVFDDIRAILKGKGYVSTTPRVHTKRLPG